MVMTRRWSVLLAIPLAIVAQCAALAARAETPDPNAPPAFAAIMVPDLTGLWRLDRAASDAPPPGGRGPGGGGPGGGPPPEGSMHRPGGPDTRVGGRGRRLPDLIHISHGETTISIEDSTGTVVQEIVTGEAPKQPADGEMPIGHGVWNKGGALFVTRTGPRGTVTEQFSLEDKGATLVVRAHMTGRDGEARDFKRVYRKQAS
jgi:hypothetical protein